MPQREKIHRRRNDHRADRLIRLKTTGAGINMTARTLLCRIQRVALQLLVYELVQFQASVCQFVFFLGKASISINDRLNER